MKWFPLGLIIGAVALTIWTYFFSGPEVVREVEYIEGTPDTISVIDTLVVTDTVFVQSQKTFYDSNRFTHKVFDTTGTATAEITTYPAVDSIMIDLSFEAYPKTVTKLITNEVIRVDTVFTKVTEIEKPEFYETFWSGMAVGVLITTIIVGVSK